MALASVIAAQSQTFTRQKQLIEHFTSQGCAYCPLGELVLETLEQMRPDLALVSIHCNMGASDIFRTLKCDALNTYLGVIEYPSAAFNRVPVNGAMMQSLGYREEYTLEAAQWFSDQLDQNETPALATVQLQATYDENSRKLALNVAGDLSENFEETFGNEVALTVYITEDSLVAQQLNGTDWINDYVHHHVFRDALTNYKGDALLWDEQHKHYEHTFSYKLKSAWIAQNMQVIAFVHRKATDHLEVINCETLDIKTLLVQPVSGDVTGDGQVDIADVNAVINVMLGLTPSPSQGGEGSPADVTADGVVDIADINAIINIMLGK